jgi:hypothetical protein
MIRFSPRGAHRRTPGLAAVARVALLALLGSVMGALLATAQTSIWDNGSQSFRATVQQKERSIFFAAIENGDEENWFGPLVASTTTEVIIQLSHLDPDAPGAAEIEVALQGVTTDAAVDPDHRVAVAINGVEVGELAFDGRSRGVQRFDIPHALLVEGTNTVGLTARGASDYSLIDSLSLSYWHTYQADADRLRFTVDAPRRVRVGGFASGAIRLVDVTDPAAPQAVKGTLLPESGGYWAITAQIPGTGTRTLLAFTEATVASPVFVEANTPSTWNATDNEHDYLVITDGAFAEPLEALIALRAKQGHTAALVDIQDVYDEFSFGQKTPQALKDFLTQAQTSWTQPPEFVVLAGDATVDPRDYAGFGNADFVPTKLVAMDAVELESATDEWFGDTDDDGVAELAMGRLPIRTVEQADVMVAKLVSYADAAAGPWTKRALLLADAPDPTWDFAEDAARLEAVVPAGYTAQQIRAGQLGPTAARDELIEQVNAGQLLVTYLGHGSTHVWGAEANLLTRDDVVNGWRPGAKLPVVVAMNCLNGFFHGIYGEESLAETMLRAPEGAVATWASSSMTYAAPQGVASRAFVDFALNGQYASVGEAIVAAKQVSGDRDVRRSWIFFGDPAMRLKDVTLAATTTDQLTSTPVDAPRRTAAEITPDGDDGNDQTEPPTAAPTENDQQPARRLADYNGDGRDDPFLHAPDTGLWYLALADAYDFSYVPGASALDAELFAAHLNDDQLADLFSYDAETGHWSQMLSDGDGTFTAHTGTWTPGWQVAVGDLDGNGRDDLFLSDPDTGVWFQSLTDGAGGFSYRGGEALPEGRVHLVDFNADRRADLFIHDPKGDHWFVGVTSATGVISFAGGEGAPDWTVLEANLDGNAWADLMLFDPTSGRWVEWRTDTGGRVRYQDGQWQAGSGALSVADLNGDGLDDFFWYDADSGAWASHLNQGAGQYTDATGTWPTGRLLAVGDLNGDGTDDLFSYAPDTGAWSRYLTTPTDGALGVSFTEQSGGWSSAWTLVGQKR